MNLSKKVNSLRISEQDYRKLKERLSYSLIRKFDQDREAFYKECVLGEKKIEKVSDSLVMGQLVHTLLSGEEFDIKFHIAQSRKPPGQMGELCDTLYTRSLKSMNEFNEQQDSFKVIFSDAVQKVKYDYEGNEIAFKKKDETKILEMFEGTDAELYYKEMLECIGKMIVSIPVIEKAERLVQKLRENPVTEYYVQVKSIWMDEVRQIKGADVFNELPILFDIDDVPYKSLVDKLIVNHISRKITIIDWKTSWDNESPEGSYTKHGYYIQAALYDSAVRKWAIEHELSNYEVEPIKFIFVDTTGFNSPVELQLTQDDINRANRGFKIRGFAYRGLHELQDDLTWHVSTGIWQSSKKLYENKGVHKLNLQYGLRN